MLNESVILNIIGHNMTLIKGVLPVRKLDIAGLGKIFCSELFHNILSPNYTLQRNDFFEPGHLGLPPVNSFWSTVSTLVRRSMYLGERLPTLFGLFFLLSHDAFSKI